VGFEIVSIVREYLKLIRPYGLLFIGFSPVFGALCNGQFNTFSLSLLLVIGVLGHIFVFVQNDYYDMEVDRQSNYVGQRPLSSGMISKTQARVLFLGAFFVSLVLAAVFFFSLRSFVVLLLSFFLMTLYNRYSKRTPGMEYVLGAAVFGYGMFGALTVSDEVSLLAIVISGVGFFQWVFSVGVSANIKDVEYDTKLGIRTTPVLFGVQVIQHRFNKPFIFTMYAFGIKIVHIIVACLPFALGETSVMINGFPFPLLCFVLVSLMMLFTTGGILRTPLTKRNTLLRYEGAHEGLALLLLPVVLMTLLINHVGLLPTLLLFVLFIVWPLISLRTLFGKGLIPLE
jgi:4-hydroxybenzoate polyprenyltransferase